MKLAIFSDIHSNLEALQAVLKDISSQNVEQSICLGDTVGYAANPAECLQLLREFQCPILLGNHDEVAAIELPLRHFREIARVGVEFSRKMLSKEEKQFLISLPYTLEFEGMQFVHASLIAPEEWDYITSTSDAAWHFEEQTKRICFYGHTHVPCIWESDNDQNIQQLKIRESFTLEPHHTYLINVGSVGQPRDNDNKACYVIFDTETESVEFRRVAYDLETAILKIDEAGLPEFSGTRLLLGQ